MPHKRKTRPSLQAKGRADHQIAANDTTFLREALQIVYRGLIVLCVPLLAIVVGGPILLSAGVI